MSARPRIAETSGEQTGGVRREATLQACGDGKLASGNGLILLGWGSSRRKMSMEIVLDLNLLAGQNDPSPSDITGTRIILADHIGVRRQHRNRPIGLISQTVVGFVDCLGTLHLIIIA